MKKNKFTRDVPLPSSDGLFPDIKGRSLKDATAMPKHFVTTKLDVTDNFYNGKFTGSKVKKEGYNVPIGQTGPLSPNQLQRENVVAQKAVSAAGAKNKKEQRRKEIYKKVDAKMATQKK
jgi:hypothetical protein